MGHYFNPDFALFSIMSAEFPFEVDIRNVAFDYQNNVSQKCYGNLVGTKITDLLTTVLEDNSRLQEAVDQLSHDKSIVVEGKLGSHIIKLHVKIINDQNQETGENSRFIQAGIVDNTKSVILKSLLYGTSEALKRAARAADEDTGGHIMRINLYARKLAILLNKSQSFVDDISNYAQLHDIGKINVAEIVRLPRRLTAEEFNEMQKHTLYGANMVKGLNGLIMAYNIALEHHEKWDGSGYPFGKKGNDISIEGRIVSLVDVFDALVSARSYKEAFSYEKAFDIITNGDDRVKPDHFDPEILSLFITNYEEFVLIHGKNKE